MMEIMVEYFNDDRFLGQYIGMAGYHPYSDIVIWIDVYLMAANIFMLCCIEAKCNYMKGAVALKSQSFRWRRMFTVSSRHSYNLKITNIDLPTLKKCLKQALPLNTIFQWDDVK